MIPRELRLERTTQAQREARAWLLQGDDAAAWLDEIARWKIADDRLRLHVFPRSRENRAPGGLFVIAPADLEPAVKPAALAFGAIGDHCWAPVDAVLQPAISAGEIRALSQNAPLVFHPSLGPVTVENESAMHVADLLLAPDANSVAWLAAPLVALAHPRIEAIGFRLTLSLGDIFDPRREGIGGESPDDLPPAPDEPSNHPLARGLRRAEYGLLSAADWAVKNLPGGKKAGGMADGVARWIGENLGGISRKLAMSRQAALLRLLEELKNNPEAGLRHALPIGDAALHRGVAPPSGHLGTRNSDFNLNRLGGGGRRDAWDVSHEMREQLRRRYLELAESARQLGEYRRAACIYAELLGDLPSAAACLAEGKFWQEAALVHRDHLQQPLEAARCFAEGRMYAEAIKIYEEHRAYEKLGELHRATGDEENARRTFRKWIEELKERKDVLGAAKVLETKLDARAEALETLEAAWFSNAAAVACVERVLAMRGPRGEHAETARFLEKITTERIPETLLAPLLDAFSTVQKTYPDRQIRAQADDIGRRAIASRITYGERVNAPFIHKLPGLAPEDRLLAEDMHRFLDQCRTARPSIVEPTLPIAMIAPLISLGYPIGGWLKVCACRDGVFVLGRAGQMFRAVRVHFSGAIQSAEWPLFPRNETVQHFIVSSSRQSPVEKVLLSVAQHGWTSRAEMAAAHGFTSSVKIGVPEWTRNLNFTASCWDEDKLWLLQTSREGDAITGYRDDGTLLGNFNAPSFPNPPELEDPSPAREPHLAMVEGEFLLAQGCHLARFKPGSKPHDHIEFSEHITAIAIAPDWCAPCVAVALKTEVHLCWLGPREDRCDIVSTMLDNPVIGFSSDGTLVVLTAETGWLYRCEIGAPQKEARFAWMHGKPVAIVPGPDAESFGVVGHAGSIRWVRFFPEKLR